MFDRIAAVNPFGELPRVARLLTPVRAGGLIIAIWLLVAPLAGVLSGRLYGIQNNDATQYLPRSAESTQVYAALAKRSTQTPLVATVVYVRQSGITAADRAKADSDAGKFRRYAGGVPVAPPIPSGDGRAVMLNVPLPPAIASVVPTVAALRDGAAGGSPAGLQTSVTGPAGYAADYAGAFASLDQHLLVMTVAVVAVILLVTYRSPVLWLVPLVTVGMGYTAAAAIVYELASRLGIVISGETLGILPVLVFGAGTDYALLLIARYREELQRHADRGAAMLAALRRAVPAMLASAATVSISLLCLLAAELNSSRGLGPAGATGIACTFVASVTLLPAILLLAGRRVFWPFVPRPGSAAPATDTVWGHIGRRLGRRPRLAWMPAAGLLAVLALGLGQARFGLSQTQVFRTQPDFAAGQALLSAHYPGSASDPALVLTRPAGVAAVSEAAARTPGVAQVLPASVSGGRALVPVVLTAAPATGGAEATVQRLRDAVHRVPDAGAMVGGDTAMDLDTRASTERDDRVVIPLVLGVIMLILVLLLRSVVAPLLLVATVVLSYAATMGAGTVVFQHVLGFAGTDYSVPLLAFVFLVALGVDYNIFLVTRIREEVGARGHREGVLTGLGATGGVITSAGIVLAATFSVLTALSLVFLVELGILVGLGVLLDTFVVRSIVVPALALDVGPRMWWPVRPRRP